MKRIVTFAIGIVALATLMFSGASAQNDQHGDWEKLTQPNENHKALEPLVGKWKLKFTFASPGGKAEPPSFGTAEFSWDMGKRFLIERVKAQLTDQNFEWMGIHGYDNEAKEYTSVWIDNMATSIDTMRGTRDGNTITYTGTVSEMGEKCTVRWVMKIEGKDRYGVEMFQAGKDGKESKVLTLEGTRAP